MRMVCILFKLVTCLNSERRKGSMILVEMILLCFSLRIAGIRWGSVFKGVLAVTVLKGKKK